MKAHDFAMKLLEGPDLELLTWRAVEYDDSEEDNTREVSLSIVEATTPRDEPVKILLALPAGDKPGARTVVLRPKSLLGFWRDTERNPPEKFENVMGYHPDWVDEEYNPQGIRECFRMDEMWQSAVWDNVFDFWQAVDEAPLFWMPYPATPTVAALLTEGATDTLRLEWLLALITHKGTDGLAAIPWTVTYEDGENSDIKLDRAALDRAMRESAQTRTEGGGE